MADVDEAIHEQLNRTGVLEIIGAENILPAQPLFLASLQGAWAAGQSRLSEVEANDRG